MWIRVVLLIVITGLYGYCGEYNPQYPYLPDTVYTVTFKKLLIEKPTTFTGTLKPFTNRITGQTFYIPDKGEYRDGRGFKYVGVFDYLPLQYRYAELKNGIATNSSGGGVYIFAGDRIDELLVDEVTSGIFISELETPLLNYSFNLVEATPEYMTRLYIQSQNDIEKSSENALAATQRNQKFGLMLDVLSGVMGLMGGNIGNISSMVTASSNMSNKMYIAQQALTVVSKTISGDQDIKTSMQSAAGETLRHVLKQSGGTKAEVLIQAYDTLAGLKKTN